MISTTGCLTREQRQARRTLDRVLTPLPQVRNWKLLLHNHYNPVKCKFTFTPLQAIEEGLLTFSCQNLDQFILITIHYISDYILQYAIPRNDRYKLSSRSQHLIVNFSIYLFFIYFLLFHVYSNLLKSSRISKFAASTRNSFTFTC